MGALLTALQALSPAALYAHKDTSLATMSDSSGNARHGSYQSSAKLKAFGLGNDRITNTAYRLSAAGSNVLALPPAGAIWHSNTWTWLSAIRVWGFEDTGSIWDADTNGVWQSPAVRLQLVSGAYRVSICQRDGSANNDAKSAGDITDTYKWHFVICRVNNQTAGSIRIDGVDQTPVSWTNQSYTWSGSPIPTLGDNYARIVMQYTTFWPSYVSDANCQALEAAFNAENVIPEPSRAQVFIGTHTNICDEGDSGIRHNQTRVLARDGGNVTRTDMMPEVWNTGAGTYDWSRPDDIFAHCASKGVRVCVLAHTSAPYMNSSAGRFAVPGTGLDSANTTWLGLHTTAWSAFATRYKAGGAGNPNGLSPIYEWWNEPNAEAEWKTQNGAGGPNATQWARYCKTMRDAVVAIDPLSLHVTGGINAWSAPGGSDIAGEAFWRTAIATGDLSGFTIFGIHPYAGSNTGPDQNSNYENSYDDFLVAFDVLGELGRSDAELWLTEDGWAATTSQADQNTKTLASVLRWRDRWRSLGSRMFIFWPDWDAGYGSGTGLYSTMPNTGAEPTARTVAPVYSQVMRSLTLGERCGGVQI